MQETVSRETVSFFVFCPDFCPPHAGGSRGCRCKKVLYTLCFLLYNINGNNKEGESYGEEKDRRAGGGARPVRDPRAPRACRERPEQLQPELGGEEVKRIKMGMRHGGCIPIYFIHRARADRLPPRCRVIRQFLSVFE